MDCARPMNMNFQAARSAGCARTMDTEHRTVPEARKADLKREVRRTGEERAGDRHSASYEKGK